MSRRDGVKITKTRESIFGPGHASHFDMTPLRREDGKAPELVVVAVNAGGGYRPVKILLPHQLYTDDAREILRASKWFRSELWVFPIYDALDATQVIFPEEGGER